MSGTAPVDDVGKVFASGDAYRQARHCLEIIAQAFKELGCGQEAVAGTRMFVTDVARGEEFGRRHGELFSEHPPATSMVEVRSVIHKDMLIEIEADAVDYKAD